MHVPARAGAAEAREVQPAGAVALGDVAGMIDPDHEERHALRTRLLQGGQPVADLLEAGLETLHQDLDVVAQRRRRPVERLIGHQDRAGEIVGQADTAEQRRRLAGEPGLGHQAVQQGAVLDLADLHRELEHPGRRRQHLRQQHPAAVPVVAAADRAHDVDRHHLHPHRQLVVEIVGQALLQRALLESALAPDLRGRLLQGREVVALLMEEVADLVEGRTGRPRRRRGLAVIGGRIAQQLQAFPGFAVGLVQSDHRLGCRWDGVGEVGDVLALHVGVGEEGIAEHLCQAAD